MKKDEFKVLDEKLDKLIDHREVISGDNEHADTPKIFAQFAKLELYD